MSETVSGTTLVLGGARSGKSTFAEQLAAQSGLPGIYVATAQAHDSEMDARIAAHKARRGDGWTTLEAPLDIAGVITGETGPDRVMLVDCLTLWVTNLMMAEEDMDVAFDRLSAALRDARGPVILVSNEVGQGIVPDNAMARAFRDHAGILHQRVAAIADTVYFTIAGLPQKLKG